MYTINIIYRVRSISIGTGSKNQNLLQVSLELLNKLPNTFLLHRYTYFGVSATRQKPAGKRFPEYC